MTTARTEAEAPSPAASGDGAASGRRKAVVAVVLVVVAGAVLLTWKFKPWILWPTWVNGADKKEYSDKIAAEQDPELIRLMVAGFRDPDKADSTRITLGRLLIDKKNRASEVEAALKDPVLDVRRVALMVLASRDYFYKQYVEDPSYAVEKTLLEWLGSPRAKARAAAVLMVPRVWSAPHASPEAIKALTDLLTLPVGNAADTTGDLRGSVATTLQAYHDCPSARVLLATATAEPKPNARMIEMQSVVQMFDATRGSCATDLPESAVQALVESCFQHEGTTSEDRGQRMAAMQIFGRHPTWAASSIDAMKKILASPPGPEREVERRTAFDALVMLKDESTIQNVARYFHDPYSGTRSSAVQRVVSGDGGLQAKDFMSHLVGYLRTEPAGLANQSGSFRLALQKLRMFAPEWVGFPLRARTLGPELGAEVSRVMVGIFRNEEVDGVTRASVSEAWWAWLAGKNGLVSDDQVAAGKKARDAFWEKANAGDAAGAKAVLDAAPAKDTPLWGYERGWLLAQS